MKEIKKINSWIEAKVKFFESIHGEMEAINVYTTASISIKFKDGTHYTIGISKQSLATLD